MLGLSILDPVDRRKEVGSGPHAGLRYGQYALEYRDGAPDRHYRVQVSDLVSGGGLA